MVWVTKLHLHQPNCQNNCWQSTLMQNDRKVTNVHFFRLKCVFPHLSQCCAYTLVRFRHKIPFFVTTNTAGDVYNNESNPVRKYSNEMNVFIKNQWNESAPLHFQRVKY